MAQFEADNGSVEHQLQFVGGPAMRTPGEGSATRNSAGETASAYVAPVLEAFGYRRSLGCGCPCRLLRHLLVHSNTGSETSGLLSYGENLEVTARESAAYIDKIVQGANPAELPIEQPTRFELSVNMKMAKQLGITIPQSVLLRADRIIE